MPISVSGEAPSGWEIIGLWPRRCVAGSRGGFEAGDAVLAEESRWGGLEWRRQKQPREVSTSKSRRHQSWAEGLPEQEHDLSIIESSKGTQLLHHRTIQLTLGVITICRDYEATRKRNTCRNESLSRQAMSRNQDYSNQSKLTSQAWWSPRCHSHVLGQIQHPWRTLVGPHHHATPLAWSLPGERRITKIQSVHNERNMVWFALNSSKAINGAINTQGTRCE